MNIRTLGALGASLYLGMSGIAHAATAERAPAGTLRDGTAAEVIELKGKNGVSARILTYGATLQSLIAPDSKGKKADVVLGHDTVQEYEAKQDFFGDANADKARQSLRRRNKADRYFRQGKA